MKLSDVCARSVVVGIITFVLSFTFILPFLLGQTHRHYAHLVKSWNRPILELIEISSTAARQAKNEDLRFFARHLTLMATVANDMGYDRFQSMLNASALEQIGRGSLNGLILGTAIAATLEGNPAAFQVALSRAANLFKTPAIIWNATKFEQTAERLDKRYRRFEIVRWIVAAGAALVAFWVARKRLPTPPNEDSNAVKPEESAAKSE